MKVKKKPNYCYNLCFFTHKVTLWLLYFNVVNTFFSVEDTCIITADQLFGMASIGEDSTTLNSQGSSDDVPARGRPERQYSRVSIKKYMF